MIDRPEKESVYGPKNGLKINCTRSYLCCSYSITPEHRTTFVFTPHFAATDKSLPFPLWCYAPVRFPIFTLCSPIDDLVLYRRKSGAFSSLTRKLFPLSCS